jgi:hypothetical protein
VSLSVREYDALERAIVERRRIAVRRPTYELVVLPLRLRHGRGGEVLEARHPVTGESLELPVDALAGFEVVG